MSEIDLMNKQFDLEKEQLNRDRKLAELAFKEQELDREIRQAEFRPIQLHSEKEDVLGKIQSQADQYQDKIDSLEKDIKEIKKGIK